MSKWIRSGDKVYILTGNDKGKTGSVLSRNKDKVVVQGINIRKKHMKPQGQNQPGQILEIEKPINISNVKLCVDEKKAVKLTMKFNAKKEKELVYTHSGKPKVLRNLKKQAKGKK